MTTNRVVSQQPASISNIGMSEVVSLHQFTSGTITVRTERYGDATYRLDSEARRFMDSCYRQPLSRGR